MIGIVAVLLTAGVTDRFRLTGRCTPRVIFSRTFSIAAGTFRPVLGVVVFLHRKIVAGRCKPAGTGFPRFQISKLRGAVCCSVESATGALIVALPAIHRATRSLTADRRCVFHRCGQMFAHSHRCCSRGRCHRRKRDPLWCHAPCSRRFGRDGRDHPRPDSPMQRYHNRVNRARRTPDCRPCKPPSFGRSPYRRHDPTHFLTQTSPSPFLHRRRTCNR